MRVSLIVQDLCGQGAQASTAAMVRAFAEDGFDVDVLISQFHKQLVAKGLYSFPVHECAHIVQMPSVHAKGNIWFIRSYIKRHKTDILISTSGPYHKCHAIAKMGLSENGIIHVCMDHGNWYGNERHWWSNSIFGRFDRHYFVNETAREIFLSQFPKYPRENTHVVWNPCVDDLFFRKIKERPTHPWLINKSCPTFITAGAFCESKQHIVQLVAMKILKRKTNIRLILFGRGPLEAQYREFIKANGLEDNVSIGGYSENLPAEMKAADGYLMTSKTESFGIVIVEALAAGLHVFSTDALYGPRDILCDGKYGDLIPIGDSDELAKRILAFLENPPPKPPEKSWARFTEKAVLGYFKEGLRI